MLNLPVQTKANIGAVVAAIVFVLQTVAQSSVWPPANPYLNLAALIISGVAAILIGAVPAVQAVASQIKAKHK